MARQNQDQTADQTSADQPDTLSDADKDALRQQAAESNSVPQFQDELDEKAEQNDAASDKAAQEQSKGQTQQ